MPGYPHSFLLRSGHQLPTLGFGTYRLTDDAGYEACLNALRAGYTLIDTAAVYKNEKEVGSAVHEFMSTTGKGRADVFLTSKLSPYDLDPELAPRAFASTLDNLSSPYVDLYLIHWPGRSRLKTSSPLHKSLRLNTWATMEEFHASGQAKSIGVSNFTINHMHQLLESALVKPHVLQIEIHPLIWPEQQPLVEFCAQEGIVVQGYSPFGEGKLVNGDQAYTLRSVQTMAQKRGWTTAKVLLKWAVQHGVGVIPKSKSSLRMAENYAAVMDEDLLDEEEMQAIDCASEEGGRGCVRFCWDPNTVL
ncbi:glyoxal reductase [Phlyctochytrium arcticum]|nr:glyoxal reductase [Phlyctochytrium arcticum]